MPPTSALSTAPDRLEVADPAAPVTVVIACYSDRRLPLLDAAVSSVNAQAQQVVVVVDHNEALRERLTGRWPGVTVVANSRSAGASGARNTGAALARTDLVAFLDDDAAASRTWLAAMVPLFDDPAVIGAGGGVDAAWEGRSGPPSWFPPEFGWVVGASYTGQPTTTGPVRNVWAENMVVRASAFAAAGGFPDGFGKVAERSRPEDTAVCISMSEAVPGGTWLHHPPAKVTHHVPPGRQTFRFFVRRCFAEGAGKAELARVAGAGATSAESSFVRQVLPRAVARDLAEVLRHRSLGPARRAGATVVGTASAAIGFATGSLPRRTAA